MTLQQKLQDRVLKKVHGRVKESREMRIYCVGVHPFIWSQVCTGVNDPVAVRLSWEVRDQMVRQL